MKHKFIVELSGSQQSALLDFVLAVLRDSPQYQFRDVANPGASTTSSELLQLIARARQIEVKIGDTTCLVHTHQATTTRS